MKKKSSSSLVSYCRHILFGFLFTAGFVCILASIYLRVMPSFVGDLIENVLKKKLVIKNNSDALKYWIKPPATIYRKFYMFHVANSDDVLRGKKPILVERGPYSYREVLDKRNIEFSEDGNMIKYTPVSTLYFDQNKSNGSEFDYVMFLSLLDLGVAAKSDRITPKVFINRTVHDHIAGYKNSLLDLANLASGVRREKFGLYFEKNGTELFNYEALTGKDNLQNIGKLKTFKEMEQLNFWGNNYSNAINGSDGSKYPPHITPEQTLYFFNPDLCRSLHLEYYRNNKIEGVQTLDFRLAKNIFSNNQTLNPNFDGFWPKNDSLGDGLHSLRECRQGLPLYASLPHFLHTRNDSEWLNEIIGLKPNEKLHEYIVSLDPITGTSIKSNIRIQFNYHLKKNSKFESMKRIKNVLIPMFWLELEIDTFKQVKVKLEPLSWLFNLAQKSYIIFFVFGTSLICIASIILMFLKSKMNSSQNDKIIVSTLSLDEIKKLNVDI